MVNRTLISLAILNKNFESGLDIYDNFVPLIAECIRTIGTNIISVPEIKKNLIEQFGICIPQHVIDTILCRLRNRGYIEFDVYDKVVRPSKKVLSDDSFQNIRTESIRKHEIVLNELIAFVKEISTVSWTVDEAEVALLSFLDEYQLDVIKNSTRGRVIPFDVSSTITDKFLVGSFVKHLLATNSSSLDYLNTITKGFMLANALYLPNPSIAKRKFKKTKIYFDTTFLVYALGYAGETRQAPCKELFDLLFETGAELKCFKHTLEEIRGVLDNTASVIGNRDLKRISKFAVPNLEYFLSRSISQADIKRYIVRLERDLSALRIEVEDTPDFSMQYSGINEEDFCNYLVENIHYRFSEGNAVARDVKSILSIIQIRQGLSFTSAEDSGAIFVTNNPTLARFSTNYLHDYFHFTGISPCITDHMLTNILWLKSPISFPNLPMKYILADCFAATQPTHSLWNTYLQEIERLSQEKEITSDDYYLLRYELSAKTILMEKTLGEEGAFTQGTVREILEEVKARNNADIIEELDKAKGKLKEKIASENRRRNEFHNRAASLGKGINRLIKVIIFIVLAISILLSANHIEVNGGWSIFLLIFEILLTIYAVVDLWKSIFLDIQLRKVEVRVTNFIEKFLLKISGLEERREDISEIDQS